MPLVKPNRYKFNGNEEQRDFDWNIYDFNFRSYDPQIGRFNSIDPLSDTQDGLTPYHFSYNNPAALSDPSGLDAMLDWSWTSDGGAEVYNAAEAYGNWARAVEDRRQEQQTTFEVAKFVSKLQDTKLNEVKKVNLTLTNSGEELLAQLFNAMENMRIDPALKYRSNEIADFYTKFSGAIGSFSGDNSPGTISGQRDIGDFKDVDITITKYGTFSNRYDPRLSANYITSTTKADASRLHQRKNKIITNGRTMVGDKFTYTLEVGPFIFKFARRMYTTQDQVNAQRFFKLLEGVLNGRRPRTTYDNQQGIHKYVKF